MTQDNLDNKASASSSIPEVITTKELLKLAKISRSTLYDWIRRGKIAPLRHLKQNDRLFLADDVAKLLSRRG